MQRGSATTPTTGEPRTYWGPWATLAWGLLVFAVLALVQTATLGVFVGLRLEAAGAPLTVDEIAGIAMQLTGDGLVLSVSTVSTALVCGALLVAIIRLRRGAGIATYLGLRPTHRTEFIRWMVGALLFIGITDMLSRWTGASAETGFMSSMYASAGSRWLLWFALAVAAPVFEECFFRGFLLQGLRAGALGPVGAVVVTAALWALTHLQYGTFEVSAIFLLGCLLGAARIATGSVLASITIHALNNIVAMLETVASTSS